MSKESKRQGPGPRSPRKKGPSDPDATETARERALNERTKYRPRRRPRAGQLALAGRHPDDPEPGPGAPISAALARPLRPPVSAVADPRNLPGHPLVIVPLRRRVGELDEAFLRDIFPRLNMAVKSGEMSAAQFAKAIRSRLSAGELDALRRIASRMTYDDAVYALGVLGAVASALVHHVRVESGDRETSAGLGLVPGLEEALLAFGRATGLPPRDLALTTWLLGPWTFTGTEGERRFGHAVREAEALLGEAVALLAEIREGGIALADSADRLRKAAALVASYRKVQSDLSGRPFGPDFLHMRDFLAPYAVGGTLWEGPNATYTRAWNDLDLAVGLLGTAFHRVVRKRSVYMPPADRQAILRSMALPSLGDLIADAIGVARGRVAVMTAGSLGRRLREAPEPLRDSILAAAELAWEVAKLSLVHWGAIKKNLINPVEQMSPQERSRLVTRADSGVGGNNVSHTAELRDQRGNHPLARLGRSMETGK